MRGLTIGIGVLVILASVLPAQSYQEGEVVDGATISGKVIYQGPCPPGRSFPRRTRTCAAASVTRFAWW